MKYPRLVWSNNDVVKSEEASLLDVTVIGRPMSELPTKRICRQCGDEVPEGATGHVCQPQRNKLVIVTADEQIVQLPMPMILHCPSCRFQHIDNEYWTRTLHKTHLCASCRYEWRPAECFTVGVLALP